MWNKGLGWRLQRAAVSAAAVACLIPAGVLLVGSLRAGEKASLGQYEKILLGSKEFFTWFWNSAGYTAGILALCVPVAVLAAYGLSLHRFPGRNALLFLYTLLMLLPFQATVVAQYLTLRALGLLDTPGILWPKFEDELTGMNLAFTGAVKDEIMDVETLGCHFMALLGERYPQALMDGYKLAEVPAREEGENDVAWGYRLLQACAARRGMRISGGELDTERMARVLLDEYRGSRLGRFTLEVPEGV